MKSLAENFQTLTLMKPEEQKAAFASFLMVFLLMAAYFILRPVRDAMASDWTDSEVSALWNIQFFISIGIVGLYSLAVSQIRFQLVVPCVYLFFAGTFLLFYLLTPKVADATVIEKCFYLWVTAFSLLNLSVFWSFMSERFSKDQSHRLFAFISAGASAGAILGPAIPTLLAEQLGLEVLMLIASLGLLSVLPIIFFLNTHSQAGPNSFDAPGSAHNRYKIGGNWWRGFSNVIKNRYLLGIAIFILFYVFISSFIYFEQKNLLAEYSRTDRAQILGGIDWLVNTLTFGFAFLFTSRIVKRVGMGMTLALVPLALATGMLALAVAPAILVLLVVQVVRRVGNYSVTRPAREMLFTQVSQEDRFKSKPVIDVVVYRGGDAVSGSLFALLTDGLGLGLAIISIIGSLIAAAWAYVAVSLGKRYDQMSGVNTIAKPAQSEINSNLTTR